MLTDAITFAEEAHAGDKWGEFPYSRHLELVAQEVARLVAGSQDADTYVAAAYLHDVIEDHPELEAEVQNRFPQLYPSLKQITRRSEESYGEYIDRLTASGDRIAIAVKLADMGVNKGNNPPERLAQRYGQAYPRVVAAARALGVGVEDSSTTKSSSSPA